jgi:subtilisin family serine protease
MSNRLLYFLSVILITMLLAAKSFSEVKVAILDSGCNIEYQEGISFIDEDVTDLNGHGTSIAKIIKEYNPDAKLYIAKVLNHNGYSVDIEPVVAGIYWAISCRVDIINMSWQVRRDEKAIHDAIKKAYQNGIIIVAAAGNKNDFIDALIKELNYHYNNLEIANEIRYPAIYDEVIAIGAIKKSWIFNGHEKYSPVGSKIEYVCDGSYGSMKGTSFSAARATAIISKIKADYPDLTGEGFREILKFYAQDIGGKGKDYRFGYGKLLYKPTKPINTSPMIAILHNNPEIQSN